MQVSGLCVHEVSATSSDGDLSSPHTEHSSCGSREALGREPRSASPFFEARFGGLSRLYEVITLLQAVQIC